MDCPCHNKSDTVCPCEVIAVVEVSDEEAAQVEKNVGLAIGTVQIQ